MLSVIDHREPGTEVVHASPPDGSGLMPCCNRPPLAVPPYHRITLDPALVTCKPTAKIHYLPAITAGKCLARPASPDRAVSDTGAVTCGMCTRTVLYKTAAAP